MVSVPVDGERVLPDASWLEWMTAILFSVLAWQVALTCAVLIWAFPGDDQRRHRYSTKTSAFVVKFARCGRIYMIAFAVIYAVLIPAAVLAARAANADVDADAISNARTVMQVGPRASQQQIKSQYRKLMLIHHPDKNPDDMPNATKTSQQITEAYRILTGQERPVRPPAW